MQLSNEQSSRVWVETSDTSTITPKADLDQVRTETSLKKQKSPFPQQNAFRKNFYAAAGFGAEGRVNKNPSLCRPAGQQPAKSDHIKKQSSPELHQGEQRHHHERGRPVGPIVTGSMQNKLKASVDNWNHIAWIPPSNHKVNADPAFNSASYINQTRCSEQWLTRVSQFPPTMLATLVVTQFVSIIRSLESPLAAFIFMLLFQMNMIQLQRDELARSKKHMKLHFQLIP